MNLIQHLSIFQSRDPPANLSNSGVVIPQRAQSAQPSPISLSHGLASHGGNKTQDPPLSHNLERCGGKKSNKLPLVSPDKIANPNDNSVLWKFRNSQMGKHTHRKRRKQREHYPSSSSESESENTEDETRRRRNHKHGHNKLKTRRSQHIREHSRERGRKSHRYHERNRRRRRRIETDSDSSSPQPSKHRSQANKKRKKKQKSEESSDTDSSTDTEMEANTRQANNRKNYGSNPKKKFSTTAASISVSNIEPRTSPWQTSWTKTTSRNHASSLALMFSTEQRMVLRADY